MTGPSGEVGAVPQLVFERVPLGSALLDEAFGPGIHFVLGTPAERALRVFQLAAGVVAPKRGRVTLAGRAPHASPALRRTIASADWMPLPHAARVSALVGAVSRLQGQEESSVFERLQAFGDDALWERPTASLEPRDVARVQLAMALSTPGHALLLLWRPFDVGWDESSLMTALEERAESAPVLLFSSAPRVSRLPGRHVQLGVPAAAVAAGGPPAGNLWISTDRIDLLARHVASLPGATGAELLHGDPGLLRVGVALEPADARERLSAAAIEFARDNGLAVRGLRFEGPET